MRTSQLQSFGSNVTALLVEISEYLFSREHWSVTVGVNDVEGDFSRGGKWWAAVIFGLKNNLILLYFLKHMRGDSLEIQFLCTVFF